MSESADAIKAIENEMLKIKQMRSRIPIHIRTRSQTADKSSATNNKPSATKNKEDTALTTNTEASTTNTRKSIHRTAKDNALTALAKNNSSKTNVESSTKRKSSTTSARRSSQKPSVTTLITSKEASSTKRVRRADFDNQTDYATAKYAADFKYGGDNRLGISNNIEKQAIRTRGVIPFKVLMAALAGWHADICSPVEHTLDTQSAEAKRLVKEGKEPQISFDKLDEGQLAVFQAFDIEETPADKETANVVDFATTMLIEASSGNSQEALLRNTVLIRANDFKEASSNASWHGGTKDSREAAKRKSMRFYKKDCLEKGGKNSFFGNGFTLRDYYVREGKWNIEYIRSLGEDEETEDLLDALLFEEDAESVDELFE